MAGREHVFVGDLLVPFLISGLGHFVVLLLPLVFAFDVVQSCLCIVVLVMEDEPRLRREISYSLAYSNGHSIPARAFRQAIDHSQ